MRPSKKNYLEIPVGTAYGHWTTSSKPYRHNNETVVEVTCKCKKKSVTRVSRLIEKTSTSCGCKPRNNNRGKYKSSFEEAAHNEIYRSISNGAKNRNYSFELSKKDVKNLVQQNCFYCGSEPSNIKKIKGRGELRYNGIDRLDNHIGYVLNNCRPCCSTCNTIKLDLSGQDLIEHLHKMIRSNQLNETISEKKLHNYYTRTLAIAQQSHDQQTKVAAILIHPKTGAVMAEGYNGFIRGAVDSKLPATRPEKYNYIIHAETNLICNAVRSGVKTDDGIIFCTLSPCIKCLRMLWQAGIKIIYFKDMYSDFETSSSMLDLKVDLESIGSYYKITVSPRSI
jgi:dCMP deaminase